MSWLPDWLTGYDAENAARADAADAERKRIAKADLDRGYVDRATYEQMLRDYATEMSYDPAAQRESIQEAFDTELRSRAKTLVGNPLEALWDVIVSILKAIPLWVWLALAVGLFLWLGGGSWLTRKARAKLA